MCHIIILYKVWAQVLGKYEHSLLIVMQKSEHILQLGMNNSDCRVWKLDSQVCTLWLSGMNTFDNWIWSPFQWGMSTIDCWIWTVTSRDRALQIGIFCIHPTAPQSMSPIKENKIIKRSSLKGSVTGDCENFYFLTDASPRR